MRRLASDFGLTLAALGLCAFAALPSARAEGYAAPGPSTRAPATAAPPASRVTDPADSTARLSAVEAKRLRAALRAAVVAASRPAAPYRLDREYDEEHVFASGPASARRPGVAVAERYYEVPEETPKTAVPLGDPGLVGPVEMTVAVNAPVVLPNLTSVASDTTRLMLRGAEAAEIASRPPLVQEGRIAAMNPEAAKYRLGAVFIVVGSPALEAAMRSVATGSDTGALEQVPVPSARRAGDARWITIRVHGPLEVALRVAKRVDTRALRKLLSP